MEGWREEDGRGWERRGKENKKMVREGEEEEGAVKAVGGGGGV